jgi:hypothetical protein
MHFLKQHKKERKDANSTGNQYTHCLDSIGWE